MEEMEASNIFQTCRSSYKIKDIEIAYEKQNELTKPFKILYICFFVSSIATLIYFLQFIQFIGSNQRSHSLYWTITCFIMSVILGILILLENKKPDYHNYTGLISIVFICVYVFETTLTKENVNIAVICLFPVHMVTLAIHIEYIASLWLTVVLQLNIGLYIIIRLSIMQIQYVELICLVITIVAMFTIYTKFCVIRREKVIFYEAHSRYLHETNWKRVLETHPNGIAIIKNKSVIYYNRKTMELLDITDTFNRKEQANKVYKEITELVQIPQEENIIIHSDQTIQDQICQKENQTYSITKQNIYFENGNSWLIVIKKLNLLKELDEYKIEINNPGKIGLLIKKMILHIQVSASCILGKLENIKEKLPLQYFQDIDNAKSNCDMLILLMKDIIDYSMIENNEIKLESKHFDLNQVIKEVYDMISFEKEQKDISIICRDTQDMELSSVVGDYKKLQQILINLFKNAIKAIKSKNGIIAFKILSDDLHLHFSIKDNGKGIPEKNLNRINKALENIEKTKKAFNKNYIGIGLYLCKHLCDLMGGKIHIKSIFGQETKVKFSIRNPSLRMVQGGVCTIEKLLEDESYFMCGVEEGRIEINLQTCISMDTIDDNNSPISEESKEINILPTPMIVQIQKKILLVDDNPFDQLELKKLFTSNIRIDSTYGGEEAIELVRNEESQYGLIIIKSFLPGLDSFDTTRQILEINMRKFGDRVNIIGIIDNDEHDEQIVHSCNDAGMVHTCNEQPNEILFRLSSKQSSSSRKLT